MGLTGGGGDDSPSLGTFVGKINRSSGLIVVVVGLGWGKIGYFFWGSGIQRELFV